ncbi:MAG: hypothetical protein WBX27_13715 [Specibacter sp.]
MRFIFEYEGDKISLVLAQPVDVAVTGFDVHPDLRPGDFVEVRGKDGGMLSRVPVRSGMGAGAEVFPEDHAEPITRVEQGRVHGAFTVIAPAPQAASHVAVVRIKSPAPHAEGAAPSAGAPQITELATFALEGPEGGQQS